MTEQDVNISIETRNLGDVAREEIEAAHRDGIDPMEIARTHQRLGYIIPQLLKRGDDGR